MLEVLELVLGERFIIFDRLNLESLFVGNIVVVAKGEVGDRFLPEVFGDEEVPSFDDFLRKILKEDMLPLVLGE